MELNRAIKELELLRLQSAADTAQKKIRISLAIRQHMQTPSQWFTARNRQMPERLECAWGQTLG